ncbi:DUF4192 domain-containing protein [Streptomyces tsukubensis]|uniref:DUF4192 domain-containing protein n=1 Tax=Streptomyces tsukubensis TaxID=83656 RepID=UPI001E2C819F|nr:DUF4192 domain-containing protein [Streptomyces tsukubensis]
MNEQRDSQNGAHRAHDIEAAGGPGPLGDAGRAGGPDEQITLRGPAELADCLPYLLGYHPSDSVVLVALHGERGRFGGRVKLGIPGSPAEWEPTARQLAECLIETSRRRDGRPDGIVLFLCREPGAGQTGRDVMQWLRPFAQRLRTACGTLDVPVFEALCISGGRFWSYCCPDERCCPAEGAALVTPGTSVLAAAVTYAGVGLRGSQKQLEARLEPIPEPVSGGQRRALDDTGADLVRGMLIGGKERREIGDDTIALAKMLMDRLAAAERITSPPSADAADDRLIGDDEAAFVILGLQDRETRDRAAAWMEGPDAEPALRLWRALARRCVGPYIEHAAAPLTLAGWVAWSTGDEPAARIALAAALRSDAEYVFALLLHQACNEGVEPEAIRKWLRRAGAEARDRADTDAGAADEAPGAGAPDSAEGPGGPARPRVRTVRPAGGRPAGRETAAGPGKQRRPAGTRGRAAGGGGRSGGRTEDALGDA